MAGTAMSPLWVRTALFATGALISASCAQTKPLPRGMAYSSPSIIAPGPIEARLLFAHNRERAVWGAPPLTWDARLAAAAAAYGPALAASGRLQHSARALRAGQAENLWMGSRGVFPPEAMVGAWVGEKNYFRPGFFPAVSSSGNWQDVGHFTQLIWRGTTHVGCAIHADARYDFLICRYLPKGNVDGRRVP